MRETENGGDSTESEGEGDGEGGEVGYQLSDYQVQGEALANCKEVGYTWGDVDIDWVDSVFKVLHFWGKL